MLAARLHTLGFPLEVADIDDPIPSNDSAVVAVLTAMVAPAMAAIRDGALPYSLPPLPFTPGIDGIGTVIEAPAGSGLNAGTIVYCDTLLHKGNAPDRDNACFAGNFGVGRDAGPRMGIWRNGCFAEKVVLPADCFTPLRSANRTDPALLCRLGWIGTAFCAFRRADLRPDRSLVVTGATGNLGVSAVALALALGVRRIVAVGRRQPALDRIRALDSRRIATANSAELGDGLHDALIAATDGGADVVADCIASTGDPTATLAAVRCMRRFGVAVLLGNVTAKLDLTYDEFLDKELTVRGSNWFDRSAVAEVDGLIDAGLLDLSIFSTETFPLGSVNEAIDASTRSTDGFKHIALAMPMNSAEDQEV